MLIMPQGSKVRVLRMCECMHASGLFDDDSIVSDPVCCGICAVCVVRDITLTFFDICGQRAAFDAAAFAHMNVFGC